MTVERREENKSYMREYMRGYYKSHPEQHEKHKAYMREYYRRKKEEASNAKASEDAE